MNHFKMHIKNNWPTIQHFLTYADNYAIGYFKKQVCMRFTLLECFLSFNTMSRNVKGLQTWDHSSSRTLGRVHQRLWRWNVDAGAHHAEAFVRHKGRWQFDLDRASAQCFQKSITLKRGTCFANKEMWGFLNVTCRSAQSWTFFLYHKTIIAKIRQHSRSQVIHKGLQQFRNAPAGFCMDAKDILGLREFSVKFSSSRRLMVWQ